MFRIVLLVLAAFAIQGCASTYVADRPSVAEDHVAPFPVSGEVVVNNGHGDSERNQLGRLNIFTDLQQVTDVLVAELDSEIKRLGQESDGAGDKQMTVTVTNMNLANRVVYTEGSINVRVELGNGEVIEFERRDGSAAPFDAETRALNSVVGLAVTETLKNEAVRAYLAE